MQTSNTEAVLTGLSVEELGEASRAVSALVEQAGPAAPLLVALMGDVAHELLTRAVGSREVADRLRMRRDISAGLPKN